MGDGSLIWLLPSLLKQLSPVRPSALNTSGQQREIKHVAYSRIRPCVFGCENQRLPSLGCLWQQVSWAGHHQRMLLKEEHHCNKSKWNRSKVPKSSSHLTHRCTNMTTLGYLYINPILCSAQLGKHRHLNSSSYFCKSGCRNGLRNVSWITCLLIGSGMFSSWIRPDQVCIVFFLATSRSPILILPDTVVKKDL